MNLMGIILLNVITAFLLGSVLLGFQRKVMARIQLRPGPPIIQELLHTFKFFIKETKFPKTASMPFYVAITVILCSLWVTAVIVGPVVEGSLLLFFAIYTVNKIVEYTVGSSSGSPYGKQSSVRAVLSSTGEVPLFLLLVIVYLKAGTMSLSGLINYQSLHGALILSIPLAALMFFVIILGKAPFSPFSIAKGKDLITGYQTEHFGVLRGYLMISESILWYMLLWIFLTVFIGGLSPVGYLIGMVIITAIVGVISALTPILNPNHAVLTQLSIAVVGVAGSIAMLIL